MRILLVNDDGINAEGLKYLADLAVQLGEVWIAAPDRQCSAMSHRLMLGSEKKIIPRTDYPVPVTKAYSITGTPADCIWINTLERKTQMAAVFSRLIGISVTIFQRSTSCV